MDIAVLDDVVRPFGDKFSGGFCRRFAAVF